ncbi:MAG: 30S ribosomal protein S18 [Dehalococcoidia bacterium]|nr:30S ribosomal protein S18 [Dehalococcoidia bacterium]
MTSEERPPRDDRPAHGEGGSPSGERPERPERPAGDRPPRPQRPRYGGRRKVCRFCADHMKGIDYKDVPRLRVYISERGKIEPRRKTGTCLKHQRLVATAVKRARHLALLPYTLEHVRRTNIFPTRG